MNHGLRYESKYRQAIIVGLNQSSAFFVDSLGFVYFRSPPGNWPTYFGNTVSATSGVASSDRPIHLARLCERHAERSGESIPIVDEFYPALDALIRQLVREARKEHSPQPL